MRAESKIAGGRNLSDCCNLSVMPFRNNLSCPACNTPLIPKSSHKICAACGGQFVAEEMLASAFSNAREDSEVQLEHCLALEQSPRILSCPTCEESLTGCSIGGIQIERCWNGHGFWLDKGEWESILKLRENDWIDVATLEAPTKVETPSLWKFILAALLD